MFWYWQQPKKISFMNKTFLFLKIESCLFEKEFCQTSLNQTTNRKNGNNNCLNELNEFKFCEVSRNSISNSCWKFQFSILKTKVLFQKENIFLAIVFKYAKREPKVPLFCWFHHFLDSFVKLFLCYFGPNDDTKMTFWN